MAGPLKLADSVQYIQGVGPTRARAFAALGVHTVGDLLEYYPQRHDLVPQSQPIGSLAEEGPATLVGELRYLRSGGSFNQPRITAQLIDGTGTCRVQWFNTPYLLERLQNARVVRLSGKIKVIGAVASMSNPEVTFVDEDDPLADDVDLHEPVYPASADLPSKRIARTIAAVLDDALSQVEEPLPDALRTQRQLPPRRTALGRIHRPTSREDVPIARRRLAYDELLLCQLALRISRARRATGPATTPIEMTDELDRRIRGRLPFELTAGQDRAVAEIVADLARPQPMNRLLQADVGAGKTAVAVYAALAAIARRRQVALLAPTEVLAAQHHGKVTRYLAGSRVRLEYLAGSTARSRRQVLLPALAAGKVDLLIGTHALLEGPVEFRNLGLLIVDEQHKFGVAQRAALRAKGKAPHTLVLTATPIPRTLAMTIFGDLDVSTIEGVLPGRQPVDTRLVTPEHTNKAWEFVRHRLSAGEQAFVIYPLVEESENLPLKAATVEVDRLQQGPLQGCRLGLLHGRMKPAEKNRVMEQFRAGKLHALISTTVVEVGVDVPNATLMVIEHAERYGLSQLHQLRGRIGRGSKKSYCLLLTEQAGAVSRERLSILCATNDGFRIAEEDLRLRGPGELLGTRQHGIPEFKAADLATDFELLEQARDDAADLIRQDPHLRQREHQTLHTALLRQYGPMLKLASIG